VAREQSARPVPAHIWRHAAENGLLAGLGAWAAVMLPVPTTYLVGAVVVAGGISAAVTARVTASAGLAGYISVWGLALGGWLAYARQAGQWHWPAAAALAVTLAVLVPAGAISWATWLDNIADSEDDNETRRARAELARWDNVFAGLGLGGVKALEVTGNRAGRVVRLKLSGRTTLASVAEVAEPVAAARQLPEDAVSFERGAHAGEALMHINERDILAVDLPFPEPSGWLTVTRPLTVGLREDGEPLAVLLREIQVMVIGVTRSGKSNLLHVLIALLTRCTDVVVWVIDLKGGRLAAPWVQPWAEAAASADPDSCPRPAIDWVATTREEAELMLRAADTWAEDRMSSLAGGSKIHPTPKQPQLIIVADEIGDVMGTSMPRREQTEGASNTVMAALASKVTRKGGSEAVTGIWGTQRGVVTMTGSGDLKSQCGLRFALGVTSEADAASIIPDDRHAAKLLTRLRHRGSGIAWMPGARRPLPVKFYRLDPDMEMHPEDLAKILRLARTAGSTRPVPEPSALAAMGSVYEQRWERSALYQRIAPRPGPDLPAAAVARPAGKPRPGPDRAAAAAEFAAVVAGLEEFAATAETLDAGPDMHPALRRIYAWLAEMPHMGMSVLEIMARLKREAEHNPDLAVTKRTVHRWFERAVRAGDLENFHGRYRLPRDGERKAG
jgi:hypothetical protein